MFAPTLGMIIYITLVLKLSSKTIRNLLNTKSRQYIKSNAGICPIPCNDCKMKYIDETSRNL